MSNQGVTWNHALPDYWAALDMHEQALRYDSERRNIARDPDNLQVGQLVYTGTRWTVIHSLDEDRYGRIQVVGSTDLGGYGQYTDRVYLADIKRCAHNHQELAAKRQALEEASAAAEAA